MRAYLERGLEREPSLDHGGGDIGSIKVVPLSRYSPVR